MVALSLLLTVVGVILVVFSPALGLVTFVLAALLFVSGNRRKRQAVEERRHQEMVEAMRRGGK